MVCTVIFMSNPTVVLCWGWGFDNKDESKRKHDGTGEEYEAMKKCLIECKNEYKEKIAL